MRKTFFLLALLLLSSFIIPISQHTQAQETTYTAITTPFEARYIDITPEGILYAIDYNGTVRSLDTTVRDATWNLELVTSNITYTQYCTLWISPYWNYSVFASVGLEGIWKRNSTGWHQVNTYSSNNIPYLPWHWTENPLTGEIFLQSHARYIYNSSDGGDTWTIFYNMTASDNSYYSGTIDDHFHAIAFDNDTQSLWCSGGDTRDILRRYNSSGSWEIVGMDAPALGGLGNVFQPTSICFDNNYTYFGTDAGYKCIRINKTITSGELPLNETDSGVECIINLDETVYSDNQWIFECRFINDTLYMPTCYNDGIMLVSINGVEWINVFQSDGYFASGLGTPVHSLPTWAGGISSLTHRLPLYFVHNTRVYLLELDDDDFRHLYNEPFITDYNNQTMILTRGLTSGSGYIGLGKDRTFESLNATLYGASMYEIIENRTFEFGENGSWTESGYGTLSITSADKHGGTYSLLDVIGNGTTGASFVFPPNAQIWNISTYGEGLYFLSCWLKTNVSWTHPDSIQPRFYLRIGINHTDNTLTESTVRINITTSWTQQFWSAYIPSTARYLRPQIVIYRENLTSREVYIDDVMFWGSLKYSYIDSTRQHYVSPSYTNDWGVDETRRDTENITMNIAGIEATYQNVLGNGTELYLGGITSAEVEHKNIIPYSITILNSSQCLIRLTIGYSSFAPYLPIMFLFGMTGLGSMFAGVLYPIVLIRKKDYFEAGRMFLIFFFLGLGLFMAWVFL